MARFILKPGVSEKQLGALVLRYAESKSGDLAAQIKDMIEVPGVTDFEVVVVEDAEDKIHVIVPWLPDQKYSDNEMAHECMGGIIMKGCGH